MDRPTPRPRQPSPASRLNELIAERGGRFRALGFIPGPRPTFTPLPLPRFGPPPPVIPGAPRAPRLGTFGFRASTAGRSPSEIQLAAAASGGSAALLAIPALAGESGGPVGLLLAGLIDAGIALGLGLQGKPRSEATIELGQRLAQSASNPTIRQLGLAIAQLGQANHVLSSPGDLQTYFAPLARRAVAALRAQGFPISIAQNAINQALRGGVPAVPVLPRAPLPTARAQSEFEQARIAAGLRPNFRVFDLRAAGGLEGETPRPSLRAAAQALGREPAAASPGWLDRFPFLQKFLPFISDLAAADALKKWIEGQPLDNTEFGALAGAIIGLLGGPEGAQAGAVVGGTLGGIVDGLQTIARAAFKVDINQLLTDAGRDTLNRLRAQLTQIQPPELLPAPQPTPPVAPAPPPPAPGGGGGGVRGRLPGRQPGVVPRPPLVPPAGQPIVTLPAPPSPGCDGNCPEEVGQPGDCSTPDSPIGKLARELWNCPTFQRELKDRLQVRQRPGEKPTLEIKQPICLCCDSVQDLELYVQSGGVSGQCVQIANVAGALAGVASGG